ncbi:MAG: uroporphyrinogen decarboxylase [Alphaproteobacteria bacterium]|nr:uroporphyrinogen decarboxylase [Alphaproteobacteria bacterium]
MQAMTKPFLTVLKDQTSQRVPFWLMRQAGRYLPEYRDLRAQAGGFLDMVYNPAFACEVTLQPLRRFGMDAAILFSDILVIPHALGQGLTFEVGEGPRLPPIRDENGLKELNLDKIDTVLNPVYETVAKIREELKAEGFDQTALIGFAGAPWTVATYMVEGSGSKEFLHVKGWAYRDPAGFQKLIDIVTETTIHYLSRQAESGAEALQLFDSWAGVLDEKQFARWVIAPTKKIIAALKRIHPDIPIIGFPRGAGFLYERYARETGVDALGLDQTVPLAQATALQKICPVQGNLDPACLLSGGPEMEARITEILTALSDGPFIFNLGHGVIKDTPVVHVERLARIIEAFKR